MSAAKLRSVLHALANYRKLGLTIVEAIDRELERLALPQREAEVIVRCHAVSDLAHEYLAGRRALTTDEIRQLAGYVVMHPCPVLRRESAAKGVFHG